ncbi:MAG: hypothetical protein NUV70_07820 [Caldiserica bacterium]|jgi:hypothetical protein|nr:hypothetical protein [Caldisericota bacterium]
MSIISDPKEWYKEWYKVFRRLLKYSRWAEPLRESALAGELGRWTEQLTGAVVATCDSLGWKAVAKGYPGQALPISKQEYLAVDVMAFPSQVEPCWQRPIAAFELENQLDPNSISYSLWKVSMIRCNFGGVFCYCRQPEEIKDLLRSLTESVMVPLFSPVDSLDAVVFLVVGTRSKAEDFPDGFFRPYFWDRAYGQFRLPTIF